MGSGQEIEQQDSNGLLFKKLTQPARPVRLSVRRDRFAQQAKFG